MIHQDIIALPTGCSVCTLRASALCRASLTEDMPKPHRVLRQRKFAADTSLYDEGDRPGMLGILKSGYVRYQRYSRDGQRTVLGIATPGDVVGVLPGRMAISAAEAATDAEICLFERQAVETMMARSHRFRRHVLVTFSDQLEQMRNLTWLYGALTSRERIIAFLVRATRIMPTEPQPDGSLVVTIGLSRRDWADLSNTTPESISRTMSYLAEKKIVWGISRNRYQIRDLNVLAMIAGLDPETDLDDVNEEPTGLTVANEQLQEWGAQESRAPAPLRDGSAMATGEGRGRQKPPGLGHAAIPTAVH